MNKFLFFSLAKHQTIYFQRLLTNTPLQGRVVTPRQLPLPALGGWHRVIQRIGWHKLVEEKCQERRVKAKYEGAFYRLLLRLEMLVMALRLQALVERDKPDAVVVWNGSNRYCQLLLSLLPEGTKTFFFENGLLPDTTTLDPRGVNYFNSVPRDAAFYRAYAARQAIDLQQEVTLIPRKPRVAGQVAITLPERFVFIPFQDDRDTQVRLFSPWIGNMRELFALGERLVAETGWTVVFKEHPSSRESYPELHQRTHERLMFANGNATQELIEACEFVVTLNSTVGLESLLLGKPLLILGQAFFNVEGVAMHADSRDELMRIAKDFPQWPVDEVLRRSFLHYLQHEYCVPGRWQDSSGEHLMEVARRLSA
ncbi:capsular biosynthesis protein [Pseudomonas sp.]|uniref:capsular polysaccharide export protein, LipB/KpsS family n=1 Tax=Pseudomonas sp. TaxID=306 RepID=UPI0027366C27|nr:capsular biosynthesis protein [Pseudomonas sp.]MDP3816323.1 capsular biosynthesis protein [Pseudomonas sp.]